MSVPQLTIAICTWNRADALHNTLSSAVATIGTMPVKVLVINNNCTDHTSRVVDAFRRSLDIREILEQAQGLSHARNRAILEAEGDYLVFIDDDVELCPHWLQAYLEAFAIYSEPSVFGGPIEPHFPIAPPQWIKSHLHELAGSYGGIDLGPELRMLTAAELRHAPHGGNMAFRIDSIRGMSFCPALGRSGADMLLGEETNFIAQLTARGATGVWVGRAHLKHVIPTEHATEHYIWRRFEGGGRSVARLDGRQPGAYWWGAPRYAWRQYWQYLVAMTVLSPFKNRRWFTSLSRAAYLRGYIREQQAQCVAATIPSDAVPHVRGEA